MSGNYTVDELKALGFASLGEDIRVHRTALFWGTGHVHLGSHVRIDAYCVITAGPGEVKMGDYVHIVAGCSIFGGAGVVIEDFSTLSGRVNVYSVSDDYTGQNMTNPTVPEQYRNVERALVHVGRHVIVGSGSVIMPGVRLETGVAVGALSFVCESVPPFTIVAGSPARKVGERARDLLRLEHRLLAERNDAFDNR